MILSASALLNLDPCLVTSPLEGFNFKIPKTIKIAELKKTFENPKPKLQNPNKKNKFKTPKSKNPKSHKQLQKKLFKY